MATAIYWEPKYSIHNAGIDAEHQELFRLVNDVLAIEDPQSEPQRFKTDVKKLFRYMEFHFRHEEELMLKIGYPDRAAHAAKHEELIAILNGLLHNCVSLAELGQKLRGLLLDWVIKHVGEEDARIVGSVDRFAMAGAV